MTDARTTEGEKDARKLYPISTDVYKRQSYYLAQEVDTADHTVSIFALASNACGDPCADSQQNSIEVFTNCFKRDIYTDLSVCDDLHAHLFDGQDPVSYTHLDVYKRQSEIQRTKQPSEDAAAD